MEQIILVNENDEQIGLMEKLEAHKKGLLHRAFSVFIFNDKGEMLLQKRASFKYHCADLWSNTCCSHPRDKESLENACKRRLFEEMGFFTDMKPAFVLQYRAEFANGLVENEIDHVFVGKYNFEPNINKDEVQEYKWVNREDLLLDIKNNADIYTPWFVLAAKRVFDWCDENKNF